MLSACLVIVTFAIALHSTDIFILQNSYIKFYKTFGNSVGVFMTDVFYHSFELGQMSSSQKQAVITLIDKKG